MSWNHQANQKSRKRSELHWVNAKRLLKEGKKKNAPEQIQERF
jgi:hypothetical protein